MPTTGCRVTAVAARSAFLSRVVLLSDPRMSLVSMANSDRISKRPMLPAAKGGSGPTCGTPCPMGLRRARCRCGPADRAIRVAPRPWRDCTRLTIGSGRVPGGGISIGAGQCGAAPTGAVRRPLDASRRLPGRHGAASRTVRAIRLLRHLRRAPWRRPPLRIGPGKRDLTGRTRRQPTAPQHRPAARSFHPG